MATDPNGSGGVAPPEPPAGGNRPGLATRRALPATVLALGAVSFFTDLASEMVYPLLPAFLAGTLGAGALALGLVEGVAESVSSLLKLVSGWWSDRLERRKPLVVAGYTLAAVVRPLMAFAGSAGQVLAVRATDRVGKGVRGAPRDALIADVVDGRQRGRAFGFHRAADHAGALVGPLVAWLLLTLAGLDERQVFLWTAVPGALAVLVVVFGVRETTRSTGEATEGGVAPAAVATSDRERSDRETDDGTTGASGSLRETLANRPFAVYLAAILLFTLGNSTDAFLLLRLLDLGLAPALVPLVWAFLHLVKTVAATPGGALSDRLGRRRVIAAGWVVYAVVYLGFAFARTGWQGWVLMGVYGLYFALTEGAGKALVADLVGERRRGVAFGWYHLVVGVAALPSSLLFGFLWQARGPAVPFVLGAILALLAAAVLPFVGAATRPSS